MEVQFLQDLDPVLVNWVIIPLAIFTARLMDVSLGTLRIIFISRGDKVTAPILGFVEVMIWIVAITQVMQNLNNIASYLAWAGGFAFGSYLGLKIEEKLALGQMVVRVITQKSAAGLVNNLREMNYRVTRVDAEGAKGKVDLIFMIVKRKNLDMVLEMIREYNPKAFYSVEDVRSVTDLEISSTSRQRESYLRRILPMKKSK